MCVADYCVVSDSFLIFLAFEALTRQTNFQRELRELQALNHPNVLAFRGAGIHDGGLFLVVEFCELGGLDNLLSSGKVLWPRHRALTCAREVAQVMKFSVRVLYLYLLSGVLVCGRCACVFSLLWGLLLWGVGIVNVMLINRRWSTCTRSAASTATSSLPTFC